MHISGKILLPAGIIMMILGAAMMFGGVTKGVDDFGELGNFAVENETSGTIQIADDDGNGDLGVTFWVKGEYLDEDDNGRWDHCEATNITILSHPEISDWGGESRELNGSFYYEVNDWYDGCEADDENKNFDRVGEGLIKVGRACLACYEGTVEFESNTTVWVTNDDELLGALVGGVGAMMGGTVGGSMCCGCGGLFAMIGLILGLTMKSPEEKMALTLQQAEHQQPKDEFSNFSL